MEKKVRICPTCGREYKYCPRCQEDRDKPTWMFAWDTYECRQVFNLLSNYNSNAISREEVVKELKKVVTNTIVFEESIQKQLDVLLKEEKAPVVNKENYSKNNKARNYKK